MEGWLHGSVVLVVVLLFAATPAGAAERCRLPEVAPDDYARCLERLPAKDRVRLIAKMGSQREDRARRTAATVLAWRVLKVGRSEHRAMLSALVQLGFLAPRLVRSVPSARQLVTMMRARLRLRPGERSRGQFTGVDCVTVGRTGKTLRCGREVLERITARACGLLPSRKHELTITCKLRWCRPCQREGIDVTLQRRVKGRWQVHAAVLPHLPPHGCGFGCR